MAVYDSNQRLFLAEYQTFMEAKFFCPRAFTFSNKAEIRAWLWRTFPDLTRLHDDLLAAEQAHEAARRAIWEANAAADAAHPIPDDPERDPKKEMDLFLDKVRTEGLEAAEAWWQEYDPKIETENDRISNLNYKMRHKATELTLTARPDLHRHDDAAREALISARALYKQALAVACETCRTEIFEMAVGLRPVPVIDQELAILTSEAHLG